MNIQVAVIGVVIVVIIIGAAIVWVVRQRAQGRMGFAAARQQARGPVGGSRGRPVIRIEACPEDWLDRSPTELASPAETKAVGAIVDIATRSGTAVAMGTGGLHRIIRVAFSPSVQAALDAGLARPMPAPGGGTYLEVVGQHSRIIGKGWLISGTYVSPAALAAAAWQVLAVVTAQHYLVLISDSLKNIQSGIEDIKSWLDVDKATQLQAALRYLGHLHDVVADGLYAEPDVLIFAGELERIRRETYAMEGLYRVFMDRELQRLSRMRLDGWITVEGRLRVANDHLNSYQQYANACLTALVVEAAILTTRCSLPLPHGDVAKQLSDLRTETGSWRQHMRDGFGAMIDRLYEVGPRIGDRAPTREAWLKNILAARGRAEEKHDRTQAMLGRIQQAIEEQTWSTERPIEYIVKISDDGRPSQVRRYHPAQSA
jgi:hypothetical protein